MKILVILIIMIQMFCLISCNNKDKGDEIMKEVFYKEYLVDDSGLLKDVLKNEYDITEIKTFFENSNDNENIGFDSVVSNLSFEDVNRKFPIEILRSDYYSVFRIKQGGYYYIFWENTFNEKNTSETEELYVYFSVYLSDTIEINKFDSLILGNSTAADVKKIDPFFELTFLMSNGIYSYSYLNPESLFMIKYAINGELKSYDNLIVEEKKVISRGSIPSCLGSILSYDLP